MKHLRHLTLFALLFCLIVRPGNGCSPGDAQAVFIRLSGPDAPYKAYAAGRLGVVLPSYRPRHLVIAYDYLNGRKLTPEEQIQADAAEHAIGWEAYRDNPLPKPLPAERGLERWKTARIAVMPAGFNAPETDRKLPGVDYESFTNCFDDAFLTAANTLDSRAKAHGSSSPEVLDWLHAQDAVFSNCGDKGTLPQLAPSNAPAWLMQDRAYQRAAANLYATNFDAALTGFRAIAADHASPWTTLAPYLVARTLIRQTTLPPAVYGDDQKAAADKARVKAGFAAALQQIDTILHDPAMKSIYPSTQNLRDLVAARVEPEAQAQVLAQRLTAPAHGLDLRHNLIDLNYILNNQPQETKTPSTKSDPAGLLAFLQTMATPTAPPAGTFYESAKPEPPDQTRARLANQRAAAQTAYSQWQSSKRPAWLVAALSLAQPGDSFAAALIDATRSIPAGSPAYTSVTYQRLRLTSSSVAMRGEATALLPAVEKTESRSSINLFTTFLTRTAPTIADYLKTAPVLPASSDYDGAYNSASEIPTPELCGPKLEAARTYLFDENAATIFNQRLPLRLLREAVVSEALPPNLRFQLANATLTRAVLLDDPATAAAISPALGTCQAALKPWLDRYNSAKTADERRLQGLFLLMRFPSAEPLVRTGGQRSTGFATYSELRDNWWDGNTKYIQPPASSTSYQDGIHTISSASPEFTAKLFAVPVVPGNQLPSPPFVSSADSAEAAREILALQHIPCASDYFANQALAWDKAHPGDTNNSELVGFAMRVIRNGCRTADTKELNHQLFNTIHQKYPNSTWAKRYTTWE
jgi:hypothetical protein